MINIHGPVYQYNGEKLTSPEIIFINDHHYDNKQQCFHVKKLLENSTCNPKDHVLIFDHVLQHSDELKDYNLVYYPILLARENTEFVDQQIVSDWTNKTKIFNFMINKPRPHRKLLLELVEKFKLTNYSHSLPWQTNDVNDIPITDYKFGPEIVLTQGIKNGSFKNAETYQGLLQKTVFEPSYISLITEPAFYERETIITEKTLMAIYGGTLPIWVGGWRIPDYMRNIGFDVFDDIVDHSYQDLADPVDRCSSAVERNLELLKSWSSFTEEHIRRLKQNLALLESNYFEQICQQKFDQLPKNIQQELTRL